MGLGRPSPISSPFSISKGAVTPRLQGDLSGDKTGYTGTHWLAELTWSLELFVPSVHHSPGRSLMAGTQGAFFRPL